MSKFIVGGFDPISGECISGNSYNRVDLAIRRWFILNEHYPTCVSINVSNSQDANRLIEWSCYNKEKILNWHERYNCSYNLRWLLEQLEIKLQNKFSDKDFRPPVGLEDIYSDQVFPYCLG